MEKPIVITADKDLKKELTELLNKELQGGGRGITLILDDIVVSKNESGDLSALLSQVLTSNNNDVVVITKSLSAGALRDYLGLNSIIRPAIADKVHVENFSTIIAVKDLAKGNKDKDFIAEFKVPDNAYFIASQNRISNLDKSNIEKIFYTKYTNINTLKIIGSYRNSTPYSPDNLPIIGISTNCMGIIGVDKSFAVINADITNKKQLFTFLKNLK